MHPYRLKSASFSKSIRLPLLACAALGVCGAYSAVRADEKQEKKEETREVSVFVSDDVDAKKSDVKISDEDRKKLNAELDALTKERGKLDEKIRALHNKLGRRVQGYAIVNGKRMELPAGALHGGGALSIGGDKELKLLFKDGKPGDVITEGFALPHVEALGKDGEKRVEIILKGDVDGKLGGLSDLSPEHLKEMEKHMAEARITLKRSMDKMPRVFEERVIIDGDKAPGASRQLRFLRGDSDSRIRELERRIEALEKRLKMKAKSEKDVEIIESELF